MLDIGCKLKEKHWFDQIVIVSHQINHLLDGYDDDNDDDDDDGDNDDGDDDELMPLVSD